MSGRVLVVDDSTVNLKLLAAILGTAGLETTLASDAESALRIARERPPDVALLDVMMPGRSGYELCAEMKAIPELAEVPVIFLSALNETEDKLRGLALGAADYIGKPFDGAEVVARVQTHLRLRRLQVELEQANRELQRRSRQMEDDLHAAAEVQRAFLPRPGLDLPGLRLAWSFRPCSSVGGDLAVAVPLPNHQVALWVLDVSGHGVPAALVAASVAQSLMPSAGLVVGSGPHGPESASPERVLMALDTEYPIERFDRFFTLAYVLVDADRRAVRSCSAGHPPPVLVRADGSIEELHEGGGIVGLGLGDYEGADYPFLPGDRIVLYTDGIVEHGPVGGAAFGPGRLLQTLSATRDLPLAESLAQVEAAVTAFGQGAPPRDDSTLLAVEFCRP